MHAVALLALGAALLLDARASSPAREGYSGDPTLQEARTTWRAPGLDAVLLPSGADPLEVRMADLARASGRERHPEGAELPFGRYVATVWETTSHGDRVPVVLDPLYVDLPGVYELRRFEGADGKHGYGWFHVHPGGLRGWLDRAPAVPGGEPAHWGYKGRLRSTVPTGTPRFGAAAYVVPPGPLGPIGTPRTALRFAQNPLLVLVENPACSLCRRLVPVLERASRGARRWSLLRTTPDPTEPLLNAHRFPTVRLVFRGRLLDEAPDAVVARWIETGDPDAVAAWVERRA